jgi:hypothetical protein
VDYGGSLVEGLAAMGQSTVALDVRRLSQQVALRLVAKFALKKGKLGAVSTPSASTGRFSPRPSPSTNRTIAAAWPPLSTDLIKEPSILTLSNGKGTEIRERRVAHAYNGCQAYEPQVMLSDNTIEYSVQMVLIANQNGLLRGHFNIHGRH